MPHILPQLFYVTNYNWLSLTITCRGVHGSVRVGFMPNPQPTRFHRVNGWTTRRRPQTTSGRVGSDSGGQRSGRSASHRQSITGFSPIVTGFSPDRSWKSTHQTQIWAKITDLSKNRSKNITWSSDLSEKFISIAGSKWKSKHKHQIFAGSKLKITTLNPDLSENH